MKTSIIICDTCEGRGTFENERMGVSDYGVHKYIKWTEKCRDCNGSGRMRLVTTIQPYVPEKPTEPQ